MDNRSQRQRQRQQAERQKYLRIQRAIRIAAILLAIVLAIISLAQSCALRKDIQDLAAQLREKKLKQAQEAMLAAQAEPSPEVSVEPASQGIQVTLSFVGDCTLGIDSNREDGGLIGEYYEQYGASYFFQNVRSIFEGDDLTTASLVGSLTTTGDRQNWDEAYLADPAYVEVLTSSGIDAVTVANAHSYDYSDEGYVDTLANLDKAGVKRFGYDNVATAGVTGVLPTTGVTVPAGSVTVGLLGVYEKSEKDYESMALEDIAALREQGANIVVAVVHWTSTVAAVPDDRQILMAHKLIDSGADLVVGIQPDVLQGIEVYHDRYVVYSLGTFLSAQTSPAGTDSLIFQQTFTVDNGQCQGVADYTLIPCTVTGDPDGNNCRPALMEGEEKQRALDRIYDMSVELDGGIYPDE